MDLFSGFSEPRVNPKWTQSKPRPEVHHCKQTLHMYFGIHKAQELQAVRW